MQKQGRIAIPRDQPFPEMDIEDDQDSSAKDEPPLLLDEKSEPQAEKVSETQDESSDLLDEKAETTTSPQAITLPDESSADEKAETTTLPDESSVPQANISPCDNARAAFIKSVQQQSGVEDSWKKCCTECDDKCPQPDAESELKGVDYGLFDGDRYQYNKNGAPVVVLNPCWGESLE